MFITITHVFLFTILLLKFVYFLLLSTLLLKCSALDIWNDAIDYMMLFKFSSCLQRHFLVMVIFSDYCSAYCSLLLPPIFIAAQSSLCCYFTSYIIDKVPSLQWQASNAWVISRPLTFKKTKCLSHGAVLFFKFAL